VENKEYLEIAMKYGGFMAQDSSFLSHRLENLRDEAEKRLLVTPPASVLNAYFAELYQKRSPEEATNYFFELSQALDIFVQAPSFDLEGQVGHENFRFVRLNLSGKSFGYCYRNGVEEAVIFSEFPQEIDAELIFEMTQIFQHYILHQEEDKIIMIPEQMESFVAVEELSDLTNLDENEDYIRLSGYSIEDIMEQAEKIGYFDPIKYHFEQGKFYLYISKVL